ncbi:cell cycle histidine kinase CckA [Bosea sp. (in: a-proteobacteria)]|uniref:cell cycle histidine kinase CckA n=1 Tax=Bosea sp. (in: a-proteobacteria) TaxID=1871050 RepID=UPI00086A274B|nr:response regulator [Bosea sp. (in: a-proteobacteria)]MBN9436020.1 response regulator [Bosea sp. (in: a-proteobacteria)]ODT56323.1 MAG: hybrid sensor histidine kinase/response regulator [Methylobacterium sp. SCN 67-24]
MTASTATTAIDRSDRPGHVGIVLLVAGLLVGAAIALGFIANEWAQPLILGLLALLSVVGVFCLFAFAIGLLQFSGRAARNDLTKIIVDGAEDGVVVTESDDRIVYANETYLTLAGARNASEIAPVERLFKGRAEVSEAIYRLATAARAGRRLSEEIRLEPALNERGAVGWYRVRVTPISRAGRPASLWTVSDVTPERERQENAFQELQHAIDYLDHAPAGFLSMNADGEVPYLNATLSGWLDYDLARFGSGGLHLEDIASPSAVALIQAIRGQPGDVRIEVLDVDLRRRNGQSLPVRLHHQVAFGQDGRAGASRTLVLNRAAGEAGADASSDAEARFARFFHATPMAIATVDRTGAILRSNAAFTRLTPGGGQPATIQELVNGNGALGEAFEAALAGKGEIAPLDLTLAGEEGRSARLYLSPVPATEDSDGERAIVYALETTAERKLKDNMDQAGKMQAVGQLAGGIAHDFNNVLQVIINASEFLLASHKPTDPSFPDIMQIKQNAYRAAALVRQLLAFSRRQTLRPQVLALGDVLSDLSLMLKRVVADKITLDVRQGRDLWPVKADLGQLEQVVVNLAVNARDAMQDGGKLQVRTRNVAAEEIVGLGHAALPAADYVLLEVEDSGSGIAQEHLEKIFEPFFTTKEVGKGTGLGLSMVYGIVKQTGGFVFCDSVLGRGTNFKIFLPRYIPSDEDLAIEAAAKEAPKRVAADHTGAGVILLVEDEDAVRALNARMLVSRGYTVHEAASGVEALDIFLRHEGKIDLVISDVVMPEMDGPTLLGELRQRNPDTKVVFVSGYAEEAFRKNLPEGEEFHFLPKPFTMKQLVETVKATMG